MKPETYYIAFYDDLKELDNIDGVFKTVINDDTVDETLFFAVTKREPDEHTHFPSLEDWIEDCDGVKSTIITEEDFFLLML